MKSGAKEASNMCVCECQGGGRWVGSEVPQSPGPGEGPWGDKVF